MKPFPIEARPQRPGAIVAYAWLAPTFDELPFHNGVDILSVMGRDDWIAGEPGRGATLRVHVVPGASRSAWAGWHGTCPKVRLAARPERGDANRELQRFLAEEFGVPPVRIELLRGTASRDKDIRIVGTAPEEVRRRVLRAVGPEPFANRPGSSVLPAGNLRSPG